MMRRFFAIVVPGLVLVCLPAWASEFGDHHPTGALKDRQQAQAALKAADDEQARIDQDSRIRDAECHRRFLVNQCREKVRLDKELAEREVRRVRVEARDLERRLDADEAVARRQAAEQTRASEEGEKAKREAQARDAEARRQAELKQRADPRIPPEEAQQNRDAQQQRLDAQKQRESKEAQEAAARAENVREYERKQAEAAKRAQEKETERAKNEQRRAERRKQVESQEAQREAVRKKAEQADAKAAER